MTLRKASASGRPHDTEHCRTPFTRSTVFLHSHVYSQHLAGRLLENWGTRCALSWYLRLFCNHVFKDACCSRTKGPSIECKALLATTIACHMQLEPLRSRRRHWLGISTVALDGIGCKRRGQLQERVWAMPRRNASGLLCTNADNGYVQGRLGHQEAKTR